ncbi:Alpha/Beta hydrolase protein [Choanephora cucurbitarum]|nr:Alpha/Beta hydrolase protein [Choanephora cucurbitarum]
MTNIEETHCYGPTLNENFRSLDLYLLPNSTKDSPLVVFVHGGAWRSEDKKDYQELARGFNELGISAASVNYRLSLKKNPEDVPEIRHPDHIVDVGKAIEYLYHASNERYDPCKIFVVGHSAGAHIALMLLLDTQLPYHQYIQGVIGVSGIYDIPLLIKTFPSYIDFIEQAFGSDQATYYDASPVSKTTSGLGNKPVIIAQSSEDSLIDSQQADVMYHHLSKFHSNVFLDMTIKGDHYEIMRTGKLKHLIQQIIVM